MAMTNKPVLDEDRLAWLEAVAAAAQSKEQLHDMVDQAMQDFVKEADAGQRAAFAKALRERQHPAGNSAAESAKWADWPEVVKIATARLDEGEPA